MSSPTLSDLQNELAPSGEKLFLALMADFCSLCNLDFDESVLEDTPVEVDGIEFLVRFNPDASADWLYITCDFGEVEKSQSELAYRALLELNLSMYFDNGPVFGISPTNGHVVFADHYPLAEISADMLRNRLGNLASRAKEWRSIYCASRVHSGTSTMQVRLQNTLPQR